MKDNKLENGIKDIKNIKMTNLEKDFMLSNILKMSSKKETPVKSPWVDFSFMAMFQNNRLVYYIIIPLIVILSGGGVVFAATDSLPNSILYPIKVNVLEPVEGMLATSPKLKAKYESNLAKKRLVEAETLASLGKLDISTENKLNVLIENHTKALNSALDKVKGSVNGKDDADEISTNFRAEMNAHAKILDIITGNEDTSNVNQDEIINTDVKIQDEVKSKINEKSGVSETARISASKIKDNSKQKESINSSNYSEKKNKVEDLINSTDKEINQKPLRDSAKSENIVNDTHETLDNAKKYLKEADKKNKEGDYSEAYKSLLDSESSAKEAKIYIKESKSFTGDRRQEEYNKED